MRMSRYIYSEKLNPFMSVVATAAELAEKSRWRRDAGNPFAQAERLAAEDIEKAIRRWRIARDSAGEQLFDWIYSWPAAASWAFERAGTPPEQTSDPK